MKLTDPLQARLGWNEPIPTKDGKAIRLIDLVTHTSGVRREAERALAPADDPFRTITKEAFIQNLQGAPLLFAPGTGALYSNFGFDLLAQALASAAGKPYEKLLRERVLKPAGLESTVFAPDAEPRKRVMPGHDFNGALLPDAPTVPMIVGSDGLIPAPTISCAGSPGILIDSHPSRRKSGLSTTPLTCRVTVLVRSSASTNPAAWTLWVLDG